MPSLCWARRSGWLTTRDQEIKHKVEDKFLASPGSITHYIRRVLCLCGWGGLELASAFHVPDSHWCFPNRTETLKGWFWPNQASHFTWLNQVNKTKIFFISIYYKCERSRSPSDLLCSIIGVLNISKLFASKLCYLLGELLVLQCFESSLDDVHRCTRSHYFAAQVMDTNTAADFVDIMIGSITEAWWERKEMIIYRDTTVANICRCKLLIYIYLEVCYEGG